MSPKFALPVLLSVAACAEDGVAPTPQSAPSAPAQAIESPARPTPSPSGPGLRYALSFDDRAQHMIDVELTLPAAPAPARELWMATWTPGSYLLREYARQIEGLTAQGPAGAPLGVTRTGKNSWSIANPGGGAVTVRYRAYAKEPSVRTNFVDADLAVINGAALFITERGKEAAPHRVQVALPADWTGAHTGLDRTPGAGPTDFTAVDLDELLDSPLVLGDATVRSLDLPGAPHELVLAGRLGPWDVQRSTDDVTAIVREQQALWGDEPYAHYTFLNVVNETRGGLEHLDSTLMMTNRLATSTREAYVGWLGLVSHEFFHTWNVKRLRPAPLGPFDYEREVYTPSLWIAEGLTSYYDDLTLARAGLITEKEYLERISDQLAGVQDTPGRQVQTLQQASADAWIKYYRKDENTVNTGISYYAKGMLVGWLLDARIRCETDGARSLDDVMRLAYARHGGDRGYTPSEFEGVIAEVAGTSLAPELDHWLRTTDELDYRPALACFGLRFEDPDAADPEEDADAPDEPEDPPAGWLGAELKAEGGRHVVQTVKRGTPAHAAGLQVGDELVGVDGWRVPPDGPDALWKTLRPGTDVRLMLGRRGALRELDATLGEEPEERWKLEVDDDATAEAAARRADWLRSAIDPPTR